MIVRPTLTRRAALAQAAALLALPATAQAQPSDARAFLDLPYYDGPDADAERHKLNLITPADASRERPAPALIWFPGGAWALGSRDAETGIARRFARAGIATAAVDHRMSANPFARTPQPEGVRHPAHAIDCARATAWAFAHAEEYNLDPRNIFIGGFSSGAHLAALLAMNERYLADQGVDPARIRAAIPVSGAYDMPRYYRDQILEAGQAFADRHVGGVFGPQEHWREASPNSYIATARIPMLVVSDGYTANYTRWFEEEVAAAGRGNLISFRYFTRLTHTELFVDMRDNRRSAVRRAIVDYIFAHRA